MGIWISKREFLNVFDLAKAIEFVSQKIEFPYLNIGSGDQISIKIWHF